MDSERGSKRTSSLWRAPRRALGRKPVATGPTGSVRDGPAATGSSPTAHTHRFGEVSSRGWNLAVRGRSHQRQPGVWQFQGAFRHLRLLIVP
jgi:hypothetical protein